MNEIKKYIEEVARTVVERNGFIFIDVVVRGNINKPVIEVFIDGEEIVSADDCAHISRELEKEFDAEQKIKSTYRLDVSSPGVDRPLKYLKQFPKHVNRMFDISYKSSNGIKQFTGTLTGIEGENLVFVLKQNQETIIKFSDITKANVIVSFS